MQASLRDLALNHHLSQSFIICQRTLLQCHEIIFGDLPPPPPSLYSTMDTPFLSRFAKTKVKARIEPALVGLGVILAGAPGMPQLTEIMGEVAVEQGRADDDGQSFKSLEYQDNLVTPRVSAIPENDARASHEDDSDDMDAEQEASNTTEGVATLDNFGASRNNLVTKTSLLARRGTFSAAQTTPALPLHLRTIQRSSLSHDPLDQLHSKPVSRPTTPSQSSPSVSSIRTPIRSNTANAEELLLQKYDLQSQSHLLRSHYCRSEVCPLLLLPS